MRIRQLHDGKLVVFWIINRHRDSIELLHSFQEVFTDVPVHVCRNLYFGEARRFDMYNSSKAREAVEKNGMTLDFPAVGNRVADWLYSKRMSIRAAILKCPSAHGRNYSVGGRSARRCLNPSWEKRHEHGRYD